MGLAEAVGTATGVPFGQYEYADSLGAKLIGVPVVVPLAWAMFAYPCLLVGQRLARSSAGATAVGAWALVAWDLFLDPQMVEAGHWRWTDVEVGMPHAADVPVSNTLGWLVVATVMVGVLQLLPRREADDRVPISQSYEFYNALKRLGVTAKFTVYPRQPHGFVEPKMTLDAARANLEWFDRHVVHRPTSTASR